MSDLSDTEEYDSVHPIGPHMIVLFVLFAPILSLLRHTLGRLKRRI